MKKIDELETNMGRIKFYDGIDIAYASEYRGDDFLIFFVDNWEKELCLQRRDRIISGILSDSIVDIASLENSFMIAIYQTNGFLMETLIAVKNKMNIERMGTYNAIAKK